MSSPPRHVKVHRENSTTYSSPSRVSSNSPQNTVAHISQRKRYCNQEHPLRKCARYGRLSTQEHTKVVRKFGYCSNCLAHSYLVRHCKSRDRCRICLDEHHTVLYPETNTGWIRPKRLNNKQPHRRPHAHHHQQANSLQLPYSRDPASSNTSPTIVI